MLRIERGFLLATVLTAAALVGCQRQPETPPPPPIPIAASGEPKPSSLEAEIQTGVQATITAQQPPKPGQQAARPAEAQKPASSTSGERLSQSELRPYISPDPNTPFKIDYPYLHWTTDMIRPALKFNQLGTPGRAPDIPRARIDFSVVSLPQFRTLDEYIKQHLTNATTLEKDRKIAGFAAIIFTSLFNAPAVPPYYPEVPMFGRTAVFRDSKGRFWSIGILGDRGVMKETIPHFNQILEPDSFELRG